MDESQVERILQNPKFKEMVAKKRNLSWTLLFSYLMGILTLQPYAVV